MQKDELLNYWYYFCSLCQELDNTRQYVDHRTIHTENGVKLANGSTYSTIFLKLFLASAIEFETIGKVLCKNINSEFRMNSNIVAITETITEKFPNIGHTTVTTDFETLCPLLGWKIKVDGKKKSVDGLPWWTSYTQIKHKRYEFFSEANLRNCIDSLSALLVLELYLAMQTLNSVSELSGRCAYFHFRYGHEPFWVRCPNNLPDF